MKKILIAVPTARHIEPATFKSIYDLEIPYGYSANFDYFSTYQLDLTRNYIASKSRDYDYLFSVDSDIVFNKDALKKLLEQDKDMITGIYVKKTLDKKEYEIYKRANGRFKAYTNIDSIEPFEIDACGFGCLLIKSSVFSRIEYPAFRNTWLEQDVQQMSEDLYFCRKAKMSGLQIWADPSVFCGHLGIHQYK